MKIIDLLNKIANGEIKEDTLIEFDNGYKDYCSVRIFFDRYIVDRENLNCEVEIIEEEKKSPTLNNIRESYGLPRIEEKKDNFTGWKMYQDGKEVCSMDYSVEEKKIPEKLEEFDIQGLEVSGYSMTQAEYLLEDGVKENREMINWILDYLKSKGE